MLFCQSFWCRTAGRAASPGPKGAATGLSAVRGEFLLFNWRIWRSHICARWHICCTHHLTLHPYLCCTESMHSTAPRAPSTSTARVAADASAGGGSKSNTGAVSKMSGAKAGSSQVSGIKAGSSQVSGVKAGSGKVIKSKVNKSKAGAAAGTGLFTLGAAADILYHMEVMWMALVKLGTCDLKEPELTHYVREFVQRVGFYLKHTRENLVNRFGQEAVDALVNFYREEDMKPITLEPLVLPDTIDPAEFVAFAKTFHFGKHFHVHVLSLHFPFHA